MKSPHEGASLPTQSTQSMSGADAVQRGLDMFYTINEDRDRLQAEVSHLQAEIAMLRQENDSLTHQLTKSNAERDHYMVLATEFSIQLSNSAAFLHAACEKARHAPFAKTSLAARQLSDVSIDEETKALAAKLAPQRPQRETK